jgi:4-hydroxybenzoate polyprenyltransferase
MTDRLRLLILMTRPAVLVLFGLFAATGLAQAGRGNDPLLLLEALVVVSGFLLFSVVVNDLADEAIDRVNLPGDRRRPLATGISTRRQFVVTGATAGIVALAASTLLHGPAVVVVGGGLAFSMAYSLRPVRIADRGALASLLLPAGYVAVPFVVGILTVRGSIRADDLALLAGLYVGFIGRILLKDFRDVRGDALFGKRTFLVRHGRRWTCAFSAICWVVGSITLMGVREPTFALAGAYALFVAVSLALLQALSVDRGARRDEALISAIAIVGRGMIVTLFAHLSMTGANWSAGAYDGGVGALVVIVVGQAWTMVSRGPTARLTVPAEWVATDAGVSLAGHGEVHGPHRTLDGDVPPTDAGCWNVPLTHAGCSNPPLMDSSIS